MEVLFIGFTEWITIEGSTTQRQSQSSWVLQGVARVERNKEIVYKLAIPQRTVKAYLASSYQKFSVDSHAAAVAVAAQKRLLEE